MMFSAPEAREFSLTEAGFLATDTAAAEINQMMINYTDKIYCRAVKYVIKYYLSYCAQLTVFYFI